VPFLRNLDGKSPMDLLNENADYRSMNMMLEYLSAYEVDHHSRAINEILATCIEKELPNIVPYFESRLR